MNSSALRNKVLALPDPSENELRRLMNEIRSFDGSILQNRDSLGYEGFRILDTISDDKRAGWVREGVDIPYHLAEPILTHALNTQTGAECVIEGTPHRIEKPEVFGRKMKLHDTIEYHRILPDITPHDNYTPDQKLILERYAKLEIEKIFGVSGGEDVKLILEYIDQLDADSIEGRKLDILDSGIKALDYEQMGYGDNIAHFFPWVTNELVGDSYYTKIFEIMQEREFPLNPHQQYFELLRLGGDYNEFRDRMNDILKNRQK